VRGASAIDVLADDAEAEALWSVEERQFIFLQAVAELKRTAKFNPRTIEAFERVVLRVEPIEKVSAELGLSPQEIYNAKNRVVERLREIVSRHEASFAGG
jgi:hypothetical protein